MEIKSKIFNHPQEDPIIDTPVSDSSKLLSKTMMVARTCCRVPVISL